VRREECENGVFSLDARLDLGSPAYGLVVFLGQVEVPCKERLPEEDVVSDVGVESTGCLGDTGDGLWVGQAEDVINDLERNRLEGTGHGDGSTCADHFFGSPPPSPAQIFPPVDYAANSVRLMHPAFAR